MNPTTMTREEKIAVYKLFWALVDANEVVCAFGCTCYLCAATNLAEFTFGGDFFSYSHGEKLEEG